jgi:hypothetical protein
MAIEVGTSGLRPTSDPRLIPSGAIKTALTAPGPVSVAATGTVTGGSVALELSVTGNREGYWGYSWKPSVGANEQPSLANGCIVEGFTGCTQGSLVYFDAAGALVHTAPTVTLTDSGSDTVAVPVDPIGVAVRTTAIYFFAK